MPTKVEKDSVTGRETTGHEWDGIRELNTPLPRWWLYVLYATIAISVVYYVLYPSWPGLSGYTKGILGYDQRQALRDTMAEAEAARAPHVSAIAAASLADIRNDGRLLQFALAGGRVAFADNCATCHGSGGAGGPGYPILADDEWMWGGTLEEISYTIIHGIRTGDPAARDSAMPAFGRDGILSAVEISNVAEHVLSLSGRASDPEAAGRGAPVFADNCAACHGDAGTGNRELGAPDLTDSIWLYGGDKASIVGVVANARNGVMPGWEGRLDPTTIEMLSVYVHALGGGE